MNERAFIHQNDSSCDNRVFQEVVNVKVALKMKLGFQAFNQVRIWVLFGLLVLVGYFHFFRNNGFCVELEGGFILNIGFGNIRGRRDISLDLGSFGLVESNCLDCEVN